MAFEAFLRTTPQFHLGAELAPKKAFCISQLVFKNSFN
jgi:hypothetical protein